MTKNKPFDLEYRIKHKNGRWIWLHDRSMQTYKKDGIVYADGVFSDITLRKQREEELKRSELKLKSLIDNIPGMIYSGKPDWTAEIISNSKEICGYSPKEINSDFRLIA